MIIKELGDYTMCLEGEWVYRWYEELKMFFDYFLFNSYELIFRVTNVDTGMRDIATHYLPTEKELILYFEDKISDKYTVNQYVNVSII